MSREIKYFRGPFFYKGKNRVKVSEELYKDFNAANEPKKRIGVILKQDGLGYFYYKERFSGDKKPKPAPEFIKLLESLNFKNPSEMSFFHIYELDEDGSILQELAPKNF